MIDALSKSWENDLYRGAIGFLGMPHTMAFMPVPTLSYLEKMLTTNL
jgi:hypothetical protein